MKEENKLPLKVTKKGKEFLKQMQINRIKLDLTPLTFPQCVDKIARYFKNNNDRYLEMMKGEEENVRTA